MSLAELFYAKHPRRTRMPSEPRRAKRAALLFEALEPRVLLSSDPIPVPLPSAVLDPETSAAGPTFIVDATPPPQPARIGASSGAAALPSAAGQVFHLDLDGARDVTYDGPITVTGIDVPAFQAPTQFRGQEADVVASLLDTLQQTFAGTGVSFSTQEPAPELPQSTIYVGGGGSAFAAYGPFYGLSEKVDEGNQDPTDIAFVFSDVIPTSASTPHEYGRELAGYVAHETGHLLGYEHAHSVHTGEAGDALSEVAWKPYTHAEIARDVLAEIMNDGQVTLDGKEYPVNPQIVEAIQKYPAYWYGGAVGPDGFPELAMGQAIIHPDSTGLWLSHLLDMAWKAQADDTYSPEEKLQILAWTYGFATHAAGDFWAHTLINDLDGGIWPPLDDVLLHPESAAANVIRHLLIEAYMGDATPGYDGIKEVGPITPGLGPSLDEMQRTRLPTGDVSNLGTPICRRRHPPWSEKTPVSPSA